jgi:hypothetical protein
MAILTGSDFLIFTPSDGSDDGVDEDQQDLLPPGSIAAYNVSTGQFRSQARLQEKAGVILPLNEEWTVGCYEHPKLIHIPTGKVIARWEEFQSGTQMSCISRTENVGPPIAVDPPNNRFAIASHDAITVIQLS